MTNTARMAVLGTLALSLSAVAMQAFSPTARAAQDQKDAPIDQAFEPEWVKSLEWRSIGPANMSGRIVSLAVYEEDPNIFYVGTASGGVLKTTNAGVTFEHMFDSQETVSIGHVAVAPSDPNIVWVGTGEANPRNSVSYGNGVYKSTDGGKTWSHMGLPESYQTGRIAIHPKNPDVVYVGALGRLWGTNEERGLYRTTDGGESWEKILYVDDKTGVIDIDMHPEDPNTLIVATYERQRDGFDTNDPAKRWGPGSGLHRTTDGGKTWTELTEGLPTVDLGRIGVDYYHSNPDIVYALIESERIGRLPEDAGELGVRAADVEVGARIERIEEDSAAAKGDLKQGDIIVSVNDQKVADADDLYRIIRTLRAGDVVTIEFVRERVFQSTQVTLTKRESDEPVREFSGRLGGQVENVQGEQGREAFQTGGVYRSDDGGTTWKRINSLNPRPMYFSQIRVDPSDDQYIYVLGVSLYRSKDGGKTFTGDGGSGGVHVDHHALWINPEDGRHMLLGNDGGLYETHSRMDEWEHLNKFAIGQFYHATVDPTPFYNVYGGLQDNGSWGGPAQTRTPRGPLDADWFRVGGGDGFICRVDPNDPEQIYFESQNGGMGRYNLRTGERGFLRPRAPRGVNYRFNWKTPFLLSHFNSKIYYTAGNHVFRSVAKGDGLEVISPEITETERGSATALAESPHNKDVLYVGTDDGALWRTMDGGVTWTNLFEIGPKGDDATVNTREALDRAAKERKRRREAQDGDPVAGTWKGSFRGSDVATTNTFSLTLTHEGGKVRGSLKSDVLSGKIEQGRFDASSGAIELTFGTSQGALKLSGTIENGSMKGTISVAGGLFSAPFEALRDDQGQTGRSTSVAPRGRERTTGADRTTRRTAPGAAPLTRLARNESSVAQGADDPVSGTWECVFTTQQGEASVTLELSLGEGGRVTGRFVSQFMQGDIENGSFDPETGNLTLPFSTDQGGGTIDGAVRDDSLSGTLSFGGGRFTVDLTGRRTSAPDAGDEQAAPTSKSIDKLMPKRMWVSSIEPSRHVEGRVYVTFDGHRSDNDDPWVFVSDDHGATWRSLRANLPRGSSRVLREDIENHSVLYLGTEFGAWVSIDQGESWTSLSEGAFPTVAVHEFAQHPSRGEMLVATHGRSLWIVDVSGLRQMNPNRLNEHAWLCEPSPVYFWHGMPGRGDTGLNQFEGENPSEAAAIYYFLAKDTDDLSLTVRNVAGDVIRTLDASGKRGFHRVQWDMRIVDENNQGRGRGRGRGRRADIGQYSIVLEAGNLTMRRTLEVREDPDFPNARDGLEQRDLFDEEMEAFMDEIE